jgi:hypothetical protein
MRASSFATPSELKRCALDPPAARARLDHVPAAQYAAERRPTRRRSRPTTTQHKGEYMTPETVNLRYVEISLAELAPRCPSTMRSCKAYFEEQKAKTPERFTQPEQRRVRHILIQVATRRTMPAVKAKAEAAQARQAARISPSSRRNSRRTRVRAAGRRSRLVGAQGLGRAVCRRRLQHEGRRNRGPVKTQFGYHILKLDGIQPATTKTFEQSKSDLEAEYRRSEAERLFNGLQDQLADAALQNATDIDVVARKAGLPVQTDRRNFSRTDGGGALGKTPKVIEAAFSQDVLDGRMSPIVEIEKGAASCCGHGSQAAAAEAARGGARDVVAAWKKQRGASSRGRGRRGGQALAAGEVVGCVAKSSARPAGGAVRRPHRPGRAARDPPRRLRGAEAGPASRCTERAARRRRRGRVRVSAVREDRAAIRSSRRFATRIRAAGGRREAQGYSRAARAACQGARQSPGARLVGRAPASVLGLVLSVPEPGRLLADRGAHGAREHAGADAERGHHSARGLPRAHPRAAFAGRRRCLPAPLAPGSGRPSCTGRRGSAGRWCCASGPTSGSRPQDRTAERWAAHYGWAGVFFSRLLPVIRHLIGIPAGHRAPGFRWYSLATLAGSLLWCSVLAWLGIDRRATNRNCCAARCTASSLLVLRGGCRAGRAVLPLRAEAPRRARHAIVQVVAARARRRGGIGRRSEIS